MTEYTPTEPEITAAATRLTAALGRVDPPPAETWRVVDTLTLDYVELELCMVGLADVDTPARVRLARAAIEARRRWAEQEAKAA